MVQELSQSFKTIHPEELPPFKSVDIPHSNRSNFEETIEIDVSNMAHGNGKNNSISLEKVESPFQRATIDSPYKGRSIIKIPKRVVKKNSMK